MSLPIQSSLVKSVARNKLVVQQIGVLVQRQLVGDLTGCVHLIVLGDLVLVVQKDLHAEFLVGGLVLFSVGHL